MRPSITVLPNFGSRSARTAGAPTTISFLFRWLGVLAIAIWLGTTAMAQSASMPTATQLGALPDIDAQGVLSVVVLDGQASHDVKYFLSTPNQQFELHVVNDSAMTLATGTQVTARGKLVGTDLYVSSADAVQAVGRRSAAPASLNALGAQSTLVMLVNFQDDTSKPVDSAAVNNLVFNSANQYFEEVSQGLSSITGQMFGGSTPIWITVPLTSHICDYIDLALLSDQVANNAGANVNSYKHIIYFFNTSACTFQGAASLNGTRIWMNGTTDQKVLLEQLGHNLGLFRSHALSCSGSSTGGNCSTQDAGDLFDVMSGTIVAHFNAYQKERLGYLNSISSPPILAVTSSGDYTIEPFETPSPDPPGYKALKVQTGLNASLGLNDLFYVEYRQLFGFDNSLSLYPTSTTGVLIHAASSTRSDSSFLLDMHPETPGFDDAALQVGETFSDAVTGVNIKLLSADSSGATLHVSLGGDLCSPHVPTVTIAPTGFTGSPGAIATYTATIKNNDSSGCSSSPFTISDSVPTDWSGSLDKTSINIAPGGTGTAKLTVTSSSTASGGRYRLFIAASSDVSGLSGAGASNYDVLSPFSLAVNPGTVSASPGGSANANVTTTVNAPFSNAIQLSIDGLPSGVTATFNPAQFSPPGSGKSTLTLNIAAGATPGIYSLTISAAGGGSTQQAGLTLTITPSGDFTITSSQTSISVVKGSSATATITTTKSGTFSSALTLSTSGVASYLTVGLNPTSINAPGNGTSTLTITASSSATVGNTSSFTITGVGGGASHSLTINITIVSNAPPPSGGDLKLIPQTGWKITYLDSAEGQCGIFPGFFAIDGKPSTYWLTASCIGAAKLPHEIRVDLGASHNIGGFRYLPRQDANSVGKVKAYRFYVSTDGKTWGDPVGDGTLITDPADKTEHQVAFNTVTPGRYVRFVALSEVNDGQATSMAELNVLEGTVVTPPPPPPPPPPPGDTNDFSLKTDQATLSILQGSKGSTTVTVSVVGNFSSKINFSISGAPLNLTPTFNPTSLPAPGSGQTVLTLDTDGVPIGSYQISIVGTAGPVSHSATITLNVSSPNPPPNGMSFVSQTGWKVKFVDSQESQCGLHLAQYSFDARRGTFWQTVSCLGAAALPHEIQIDLGTTYTLQGFRYLPRQDGQSLGKIKDYEFYVSTDGMTWGNPVSTGTLITLPNDVSEKQILFGQPVTGRYIRLRALSEVNGGKATSMAELNLLK